MISTMDLAIFCDSLSAMDYFVSLFILKIAELLCNRHFVAPYHPTLHPYVSACGVDKNI